MKKAILSYAVLFCTVFMSILFSSCEKDPSSSSGSDNDRLKLTFSPVEITYSTIAFEIIPSMDDEEYFAGVYATETIDGKKGDVLFAYVAASDQFSTCFYKGRQEIKAEGLKSETSYSVVYFGFNSAEQSRTTEIYVSDPLTTLEGSAQFDLAASEITQTSALLTYTPKFEGTYINGVMEWSTFEGDYGCDVEVLRDQDLAWYQYLADNYGGSWTEYLPQDLRKGVFSTSSAELGWIFQWDKEYLIYAFGINPDGTVTTDVEYIKFRTLPRENKDLDFEVTINEIFSDGVDATITPSNDKDRYFVSVQRASYVEWWTNPANGVTEDDMMYELVEGRFSEGELDGYLYTGVFHMTPEDYKVSRADSDTYIIIFGYENGPTTKVTLVPFHTLPKE